MSRRQLENKKKNVFRKKKLTKKPNKISPILRNMFDAINVHSLVCDREFWKCEYLLSKPDNSIVKHFQRTVKQFKLSYFPLIKKTMKILTRCPSIFNCNGRHILQTSQWKKRPFPPTRQIPHPSQWYWFLSSSSNKLQIKQVYCKNKNKKNKIKILTRKPVLSRFSVERWAFFIDTIIFNLRMKKKNQRKTYSSESNSTFFTLSLYTLSGITFSTN